MMTVNRKPLPFEKDLAITNFIEERMPEGRKRKGVPKGLIEDAKTKFGLKSKSAVLRAFSRGKKEKKLHGLKLHGLLSKSATPEGSA
jgi:hypothetical protein